MASSLASPLVRLTGITKRFGAVHANRNISLDIHGGRVLALLGENGAGKSTLMSILAGRTTPDRGRIFMDGRPMRLRSAQDALQNGIGMVAQRFTLVETMTVAENIILGQEGCFVLRHAAITAKVRSLALSYGLALNPEARIADLSMGEKQRVEIVKLLYRDCRVLILDEPTSSLTQQETERLFISLRHMANRGKAIVFISHKMHEALAVSDRMAILRRGRIVDEFDREHATDAAALAASMFGRRLPAFPAPEPAEKGEIALEASGLSGNGLSGISFTLRRGEVLAVTGIAGNGQKELVDAVCGLRPLEYGELRIFGRNRSAMGHCAPRRGGIAYIPEDRLGAAVCPDFTLTENFLLTNRMEFSGGRSLWPILRRAEAAKAASAIIDAYGVAGTPASEAGTLSSGNLQKYVTARELFRAPALIIAENPACGLDLAAAEELWLRLLAAREHAGILLITGDLQEALLLADRIAVMYRGRFMDCFPRTDAGKVSRIGLMMAGIG